MNTGMLAVDVGGTFTDVIGVRDGVIEAVKVPSTREEPEQAVLGGVSTLGAEGWAVFNHASTAGLNAIITRRLPKVGFLTTYGHRDILDIARSFRPIEALTDAGWRRSFGDSRSPLVPRYLRRGIHERTTASGDVLVPLDEDQARFELERLKRCNVDGIAICLINSYVNATHEERLLELVQDVFGGDLACSISSSVSPLAREYPRASTTLIDVFMKLIFTAYTNRLETGLRGLGFNGQLNFADSAATLVESDHAMHFPFKLVYSGPAAGAMASAHFGSLIDDRHLLCCDVGGTSSDMSLVADGQPSLNTNLELEPEMFVNTLAVELGTLGVGGGSIVAVTPSGEIRVGPESAGSDPGPACYGRGGVKPTMTDAFLAIGLLDPSRFNAGRMRIDEELSLNAFRGLDSSLDLSRRISFAYRMGLNNIAEGLVDIAVSRGVDPSDYSLLAFGAAGPLMLPAVLNDVRARRVIVPPYPGLFSALGLLSTDLVYTDSRSAYQVLTPAAAPRIAGLFESMESRLRHHLVDGGQCRVRRTFDGRLLGQSWETPFIRVPEGDIDGDAIAQVIASFHDEYEARYGTRFESVPVEGVTYRVQLVVDARKVSYPLVDVGESTQVAPDNIIELRYLDRANARAGEYEREKLEAGNFMLGPAVIREPMSTTHVIAGQRATIGSYGEIVIERA